MFASPQRKSDGHEKWVDFVSKFYHIECVSNLSLSAFKLKYQSWCRKNNYNYSESKVEKIHTYAREQVSTLPMSDSIKLLVEQSVNQLNSILETLAAIRNEMNRLSLQLPEYNTVMNFYGVGTILGSQLMAEIGDTRRFHNRKAYYCVCRA